MHNGRNQGVIKYWKLVSEGREKYQLYLASREWAVLKEQVRKRSGGICERCKHNPGTQVHHQTYERKYREILSDLVHVCAPCHEFESGKIDRDPRLDVPVIFHGRIICTVYLAGKVANTTWRDQIVTELWSEQNHGIVEDGWDEDGQWEMVPNVIAIPDGRRLDFAGPYWFPLIGFDGGHSNIINGSAGYHSCGDTIIGHGSQVVSDKFRTYLNIESSINKSDMVFAWIDTLDSFGTIFELGYAKAKGKIIIVALPKSFKTREIWVSLNAAHYVIFADTPGEAWKQIWNDPNRYLGSGDHIHIEYMSDYEHEQEQSDKEDDSFLDFLTDEPPDVFD